MILMLVLACTSAQFVERIEDFHAVITAYRPEDSNCELSLTSHTTPFALLTGKMCEDCNNDTWCAAHEEL